MCRLGDEMLESRPTEREMDMTQQCALVARRDNRILGCIKNGIASQSREVIVPLFSVLAWSYLEYYVHAGCHSTRKTQSC